VWTPTALGTQTCRSDPLLQWRPIRGPSRPRRAIFQPSRSFAAPETKPPVRRLSRHSHRLGSNRHRPPINLDPFHQDPATSRRQPCVTVHHESLPFGSELIHTPNRSREALPMSTTSRRRTVSTAHRPFGLGNRCSIP
jgi:hypothetical protein